MRRKLPPLASCPELRLINKTMIIEVPKEFRKPGEPFFQIVSSLDDELANPSIKFKANNILKSILENGTEGEKLDSICIEEDSLQSTQLSYEKACEQLSNDKIPDDQKSFKTKLTHFNVSEKSAGNIWTSTLAAMDSDLNCTVDRFNLASKSSSTRSDLSSPGLMHKDKQKALSSVSTTEHVSALNNFNKANSGGTVQQLSKPVQRKSQGQANNSKPFKETHKALKSPQEINTYNSVSVEKLVDKEGFEMEESDDRFHKEVNDHMPLQGRNYQDRRSHKKIEYHSSVSPEQTNPKKTNRNSRMFSKRDDNSGMFQQFPNHNSALSIQKSDTCSGHFQQHTNFEDFHQHAGQNYRLLDSEDQNFKSSTELHNYGGSETIQQVPCYDYSDTNLKSSPANQYSSYSSSRAPCRDVNTTSHSSTRKSGQNTFYVYNQNDRFSHQEGQASRTLVEIPRADGSWQNFSQISHGNAVKLSLEELPKHVFWRDLEFSEMKQILFLDIMSNPNFFLEFLRPPPVGTHIWAFMPAGFFLKLPEKPDKIGLLNMKLLHIVRGSVSSKLPDTLHDLHQKLPLNVPFTVYSNMEFSVVKLIVEANRTVNALFPRVSGSISEVYQALQ